MKNYSGRTFGRLTVEKYSHTDIHRNTHWLCFCECGNRKVISLQNLNSGTTRSCGCLKYNIPLKVGRKTPEYNIWATMKSRCYNTNYPGYSRWGGRGIKVCDRWMSFDNFLLDMGARPSSKHSLDRYPNNDGNYEPSNCRWVTSLEQSRNKRNNIWVEYGGVRLILKDWADRIGILSTSLRKQLKAKSMGEILKKYEIKKNI